MYITIKKQKQHYQIHWTKWNFVLLYENNGTLPKWHMRNTSPEINNYDTQTKWAFKNGLHTLQKNIQNLLTMGRVVFKRELLYLLYDWQSWSMDFKIKFLIKMDLLQSNNLITLIWLNVEGDARVGYISKGLVELPII